MTDKSDTRSLKPVEAAGFTLFGLVLGALGTGLLCLFVAMNAEKNIAESWQREAVLRGAAHYVTDREGKAVWQWKYPKGGTNGGERSDEPGADD